MEGREGKGKGDNGTNDEERGLGNNRGMRRLEGDVKGIVYD